MFQPILSHIERDIHLDEKEKEEFVSLLVEKKISKKDFLIQPGQDVKHEYFVVKGCLKAYYLDKKGNKHILQFAIEDWWISDFEAFFKNEPASLYIEAIEDSYLLGINKEILEPLYERIPKFERFFRIKTTNAFVALRSRILASLQMNARERYLDFCATYPSIESRVPNYHIANYLGITAESLSRIRKAL
jgi:CRP/FNR family transcriptional regulator, anaerobic regulatory protein